MRLSQPEPTRRPLKPRRGSVAGSAAVVDGEIRVAASRWFSLEITQVDFSLDLREGRNAESSDFDAGGTRCARQPKSFHRRSPTRPEEDKSPGRTLSWTDNRGNGSVLNKTMTTRYPASAVILELAAFMKKRSPQGVCPVGTWRSQQRSRRTRKRRLCEVQPRAPRKTQSIRSRVARPPGHPGEGASRRRSICPIQKQRLPPDAGCEATEEESFRKVANDRSLMTAFTLR